MKLGPLNLKLPKVFQSAKPILNKELGETGTTILGGFITDEDYVSELAGSTAISTYDRMRKSDGVVGAALLACELPIRAANWYIEPASDDKLDVEIADFVEQALMSKMSITWDDFLRQALLMLPFGFSVFEKVFKVDEINGKQVITWKKFSPRGQSTILKWQTAEGEDGITQLPPTGRQISIPIEKLLIFTHQKEGENWTGISVLRKAYRSWYYKNHIEKFNAIGYERQGLGIPYAKLPKSFVDKDRDRMETLLKNIRANEQGYMIYPDGYDVGFMDMKAKTVKDPKDTIQRLNREILISVLAQFLDLGSGPYGSRALSADQSTTFHNNLTAVANTIKDVVNKYAVKQLVDLNFTVNEYPKLNFSQIGIIEYEKLAKAVSSLVQHKVIKPDDETEDYLRNVMSLPKKKKDEEEDKPEPKEEPKPEEKKEASEFSSWRPLTFAERKVNFRSIQRYMERNEKEMKKILRDLMGKVSRDLIHQFQIIMEMTDSTKKRKKLRDMSVKYQDDYRKIVYRTKKDNFTYGKTSAANEMKKNAPPSPAKSLQDLSKEADNLTEVMNNDMLKAGKTSFLNSIQQKQSMTKTLKGLGDAVRKEAKNVIYTVPAIIVNSGINQGRRATFNYYQNDIYGLQRSEILDNVTCNYCMSIDKRVFKFSDPFTRTDGIHSNCRGIWVEIMKDEAEKPPREGIPDSLRENFAGVNRFNPPKNPIVKKDSPAADYLKKKKKATREHKDKQELLELNEMIKDTLEDE